MYIYNVCRPQFTQIEKEGFEYSILSTECDIPAIISTSKHSNLFLPLVRTLYLEREQIIYNLKKINTPATH